MPDLSTRADQLFQQAVEVPTADRRAFLTVACGGNPDLRREVARRLAAFDWLGDVPPAGPGELPTLPPDLASPDDPDLTGLVLGGRYTLTRRVGQGGMGSVWQADQTDPVKRAVAVKLIRLERGASRAILARFAAERQAIALMDHPHIARLFDAGSTPDGQPFFVMELVDGVPLTTFCEQRKLPPADRLRLFVRICAAVQHAHQKGVIHRDLKPGNILVEEHDGTPVPKVIDFGLAKAAAGGRLADQTVLTGVGSLLGTPLYMAPEQATFDAVDVDTRADVYALGVILYELLTGSTPVPRVTMSRLPLDEMLRLVRDYQPPPPSRRAAVRVANARELDWVVLKALAKERERRYETASGLARDVERFLAHEPVTAGPPTAGYRIAKFVQRHHGPVIAAALLLLALVGGIVGTTWGLLLADARRKEAEANEATAVEQRGIAEVNEGRAVTSAAAERAERVKKEKAHTQLINALDVMVSEVAGDSLSAQKDITPKQKQFLTEVLPIYHELSAERGDTEKSRTQAAQAAHRVGVIEYDLGRHEQAVIAFRAARDEFTTLADEFTATAGYRVNLGRTLNNLGVLLRDLGRRDEARHEYARAAQVQFALAADFPDEPDYRADLARTHNNLGILLADMQKWKEAGAEYDAALRVWEQLVSDYPDVPDHREQLADAHANLGNLFSSQFQRRKARDEFETAVAVRERLIADFPDVPDYQAGLAETRNNLGNVLKGAGKHEEARAEYGKAALALAGLAVTHPTVARYKAGVARTHTNTANMLADLRKWDDARAEYKKAADGFEQLATDFPTVPEHRHALAVTRHNLGNMLADQGYRDAARVEFLRAVEVREQLVADFSAVHSHRTDLGVSYCNLGVMDGVAGRSDDARDWFRKAIDTLRPAHANDPDDPLVVQALWKSYANRATSFDQLGKNAEAVTDWARAVEIAPPDMKPSVRAFRVTSRANVGHVVEVVAEVDELRRMTGWTDEQRCEFAQVYAIASGVIADKREEYATKAMELLDEAVKAGWTDAAKLRYEKDFDPLRDRDDFKKLVTTLEKKFPPQREVLPPPRKE